MITKITEKVVESVSKWFSVDKTTGAMESRVLGTETMLPMFGCRAFCNFNGVPVSGTYSRDANGLTTVTISAHGMTTGMRAVLDFTSGTGTDGTYDITRTGDNTFTIQDTVSGVTSGNVTANIRIRASGNVSTVVRNTTGDYTVFFLVPMPNENYAIWSTGNNASDGMGAFLPENRLRTKSITQYSLIAYGNNFSTLLDQHTVYTGVFL